MKHILLDSIRVPEFFAGGLDKTSCLLHSDSICLRHPALVPSESGAPSKVDHKSKSQAGTPQALPTQLSKNSAACKPFSANVLAPWTAWLATVKISPLGMESIPFSEMSLKTSVHTAQRTLSIFCRPCATTSKRLVAISSTSVFEHSQGAGTHRKL